MNNSSSANPVDLDIVYKWIRAKLSKEHAEINPANLQREFIQSKILEIKKLFEPTSCRLVTVRSEFRNSQNYLRPTYSFPEELSDYLEDPKTQRPFSFEFDPIGKQPFKHLIASYPPESSRPPQNFGGLHKLKVKNLISTSSSSDVEEIVSPTREFNFSERIDNFLSDLQKSNNAKLAEQSSIQANESFYCFFAGRNQTTNDEVISPRHIVAIFFIADRNYERNKNFSDRVADATKIAESLFDGIEMISQVDSRFFELEGLKMVANLIPFFSDDQLALADKISLSIEKFKELLGNHIVGHPEHTEIPAVYYLNASFEMIDDNVFYPRLSIYPGVYRLDIHNIGALQVSHRRIPSATKFLLQKYLTCDSHEIVFGKKTGNSREREPIKVDKNFSDIFSSDNLGTESISRWVDTVWKNDEPDLLHMVAHDTRWENLDQNKESPWSALNRSANKGVSNRSIVAFIVEGEDVGVNEDGRKQLVLPRGAFAIESKYADAFSDDDIRGLRNVFVGLASLIRQTTHKNSPLDYRANLREAFVKYFPKDSKLTGAKPDRLYFLAQTLNIQELHSIVYKIKDHVDSVVEEEKEKYLSKFRVSSLDWQHIKMFSNLFSAAEDRDITPDGGATIIDQRLHQLNKWLSSKSAPELTDNTIEFLEACTENFLWSDYLSAFSQSLGDRVNTHVPDFNLMKPGYSAAKMFMASKERELRQVVKLSTADKLIIEKQKYLDYVRYRVVNAARIPVNGLAFDTQGELGINTSSGSLPPENSILSVSPYGALVSDLVSGTDEEPDEVVTLMLALVTQIKTGKKRPGGLLPSSAKTSSALKKLFVKDLELWFAKEGSDLYQKDVVHCIRDTFRLPLQFTFADIKADKESSEENLNEREKKRQEDFKQCIRILSEHFSLSECSMDKLEHAWGAQDISSGMLEANSFRKQRSIVHGDMNARNLIWSVGLDSFFIIDFEHVGEGFRGADQFRLIVNIVGEVYGASHETYPTLTDSVEECSVITSTVDAGVKLIIDLSDKLLRGDTTYMPNLVNDLISSVEVSSNFFKNIATLMSSVHSRAPSRKPGLESQWNRFWGYVLFCASLKEFEYSCRGVKSSELVEIISAAESKKLNLYLAGTSSLEAHLIEYFAGKDHYSKPRKNEALYSYFRHFVTAKILLGIINS